MDCKGEAGISYQAISDEERQLVIQRLHSELDMQTHNEPAE